MRRERRTKRSASMRTPRRRRGIRMHQGRRRTITEMRRMMRRRMAKRRIVASLSVVVSSVAFVYCTPITTRPPFFPDRRAPVVTLNARPEPVTVGIDSLVRAESLEVAHVNARDGYVETAWSDTKAHRPAPHAPDVHEPAATRTVTYW